MVDNGAAHIFNNINAQPFYPTKGYQNNDRRPRAQHVPVPIPVPIMSQTVKPKNKQVSQASVPKIQAQARQPIQNELSLFSEFYGDID